MSVSPITDTSWAAIQRLQQAAYAPSLHEECEVLTSKWQASPDTCFQYLDEAGNTLAYLLTHPWNSSNAPKLNDALPAGCTGDQLFIHDLAVSPEATGQGVAKQLLAAFFARAAALGYTRFMLVAVQDSVPFWSRYGFLEQAEQVSESYGDGARLMRLERS